MLPVVTCITAYNILEFFLKFNRIALNSLEIYFLDLKVFHSTVLWLLFCLFQTMTMNTVKIKKTALKILNHHEILKHSKCSQ